MSDEAPGSTKPYLIRAIYDWCLDEAFTPQIMVDAGIVGVEVPLGYVEDGKIVLNLHPSSVRSLEIGNEYLMFSARFAGRPENLIVPVIAVMAVYARENGHGIVFQADGSGMSPPPPSSGKQSGDSERSTTPSAKKIPAKTNHLKVVK